MDNRRDRMFEANNRVSFAVPIDADAQAWWTRTLFDPFDLTPEDIGDRLSASWSGDKSIVVTSVDPVRERFSINVAGDFGDGNFWFHARTLDFKGKFLNADRMFIPDGRAGRGLGRRFMNDAIELARTLGFERVRLEAEKIGRYAWIKTGFLPDRTAWATMAMMMKSRLVSAVPPLAPHRLLEILSILQSPDPQAVREIADLKDPVPSFDLPPQRDGSPALVPLGRALLLEIGFVWSGEFDLNDQASNRILKAYLGEPT